ncbi:basal-body rod modification protein FlgD [Primorskyibacter flagellatus]|uniref:Basal-body rod modification protein FlgD n=1 Tax=Primorskyibacter flagellatus TaxID=1387277 RepID=A0A917EJ47_9RHOB|nr:flagellar hook capping FlgD N-terminal domain-containing protein [Primorskyibacter flagellatus]GGE47567.1 basal-body rod modification protein FlgD [Primorskyibacter flagellatus]
MDIGSATAAASNGTTAAGSQKAVISSDFETFLKMLSTQLKNQDPLNPVDSTDYATQLATFSSVEQQVLTNSHLEDLIGRIQLSGMSDLAGWVGMQALSTAPAQFDGKPVDLSISAPARADRVTLVVRDASGNTIFRDDLEEGQTSYAWDGEMASGAIAAPGRYSFEVESRLEGELISTEDVASYSRVTEARRSGADILLVVEGGGMVMAASVTGIRA